MRKLSSILALLLLAVLTFSACTPEAQPTEPTVPTIETVTPPTAAPSTTVPPTAEPTEPPTVEATIPEDAPDAWLLKAQFEASDETRVLHRYVGQECDISLDEIGLLITIPQTIDDKVQLIHSYGDYGSYFAVSNKELDSVYQKNTGYGSASFMDGICTLWYMLKPEYASDEYLAEILEHRLQYYSAAAQTEYLTYAGENEKYVFFLEMGFGLADYDENRGDLGSTMRAELIEAIGQEAYDEIASQLTCTPEEALAMFQFTTPAE